MIPIPVEQEIEYIVIWNGTGSGPGDYPPEVYRAGYDDVAWIELCVKSGMHADIPYVRVWRDHPVLGQECLGEWCQHNIVGIYFKAKEVK